MQEPVEEQKQVLEPILDNGENDYQPVGPNGKDFSDDRDIIQI